MSESENTNKWDAKMNNSPEEVPEISSGFPWHKIAFMVLIPWAIIKWLGKYLLLGGSWVYAGGSKR